LPRPREVPLLTPERSLSERATDVIRELVLGGEFRPGERLNEGELATMLGVSRGPIRDALQRLASAGLIELQPRRGAFIPDYDAAELTHRYEVREALEVAGARLAAVRGRQSDIDELRGLLSATADVLNSGAEVSYPADLDLHLKIIAMARNPHLIEQTSKVHLQIRLIRSRSSYQPQRAREALQEHALIVSAIADRDAEAAEAAMRSHLTRSLEHAKSLFGPEGSDSLMSTHRRQILNLQVAVLLEKDSVL
jgi:DNA-binding GntR family transcriptional regulator